MNLKERVHSRCHVLSIGDRYGVLCFLKRDDELSALVSGSKMRKYLSLIPRLKKQHILQAGLIGSENSNQLLGLSSLLIENSIQPFLFVLESSGKLHTNACFTRLFVPKQHIFPISRSKWPEVEEIARSWQKEGPGRAVISEGGNSEDVLEGLLTLADDIEVNENECGKEFTDILVDAGSGLTAAVLIAAFSSRGKKSHIHVMLAAGTTISFEDQLQKVLAYFGEKKADNYTLYRPPFAKSFGSTNNQVFQLIKKACREEGVLFDPIYSIKLYALLEKLLQERVIKETALMIHSGGVFSTAGFTEQLTNINK